ncbi:MAG: response regulator [Pseudomonadota bacterium]
MVEDLDGIRGIMAKMLTAQGHCVIEASDGEDATLKANANQLDLIITEIVLAGRNGFDFVRDIAPKKPATRFMLIDRENAGDMGVPSDIDALVLPSDLKTRGYKWLASLLPD